MAKSKNCDESTEKRARRPANNPEVREQQMIALAVDLAEKQLLEGTASSQVITHYLKLGSIREKLEREKLVEENRLLRAKAAAIDSQIETTKLYEDAIRAMKIYDGSSYEK